EHHRGQHDGNVPLQGAPPSVACYPSLGVRPHHLRQRRSHRAPGLRWALASHSATPSRARPTQKIARDSGLGPVRLARPDPGRLSGLDPAFRHPSPEQFVQIRS
ncbi:MAG TPA: hypothetical protein VEH31_35685, partial [Streptosporangiaceae bacterium]|nr:hypothetical protein [Streptosporangiaceae bacterium]